MAPNIDIDIISIVSVVHVTTMYAISIYDICAAAGLVVDSSMFNKHQASSSGRYVAIPVPACAMHAAAAAYCSLVWLV